MKKTILISTLVLFLSAPMAIAGFYGKRGPDGPNRFDGRGMRQGNILVQAEELGLTDEQTQKIKDLAYTHHSEMIDLKAELEKTQLEMRHEMLSDNPSKEKVLALTRKISDIKAQMAEAITLHRFDVHGLLTAEQLEKLKTFQGPGWDGYGRAGYGKGGPGMGMMRGQGGNGVGGMQRRDGSCGR